MLKRAVILILGLGLLLQVSFPAASIFATTSTPQCYNTLRQFSAVVDSSTGRVICEPSNPNIRYGVASVSKMVTALTVLKLVDEGKLQLDKPFISQLTSGSIRTPRDSRWHKVTVRQLLNHSGGLSNYYSWFFHQSTAASLGNSWRVAASRSTSWNLSYSPGNGYKYSNMNYALLGLLIEQKAATSYMNAAEIYVFKKLNVPTTHYRFVSQIGRDGNDHKHPYWSQWKYGILGPAGGWSLTPRAAAVLNTGFHKLIGAHPKIDWYKGSTYNSTYGLGVMYYGGKSLRGHTGTIAGVRTATVTNPGRKRTAAVLYNGTGYTSGSQMKSPAIDLTNRY